MEKGMYPITKCDQCYLSIASAKKKQGSALPLGTFDPISLVLLKGFALRLGAFDPITWSHLPRLSRSPSL